MEWRHAGEETLVCARLSCLSREIAISSFASSRHIPFETACLFARVLGWIAYKIDKRCHRLVATENLQKAFPDQQSDAQVDAMVRGVYRHFCTLLIEIMHMPRRFHLHNYKQHVVLHEPRRLLELFMSGRGIRVVTAHFGNWEMAGYVLGMLRFPCLRHVDRSTIRISTIFLRTLSRTQPDSGYFPPSRARSS